MGLTTLHDIDKDILLNEIPYRVCKIYRPQDNKTGTILNRMLTGSEASIKLACDMRQELVELKSQYQVKTIHLFLAVPVGLAMMIGYYSNALESYSVI